METKTASAEAKIKNPVKIISGLFQHHEEAERAYQTLLEHGYTKDEINLVMSEETHKKYFVNEDADTEIIHDKTVTGAGVGAAVGGASGTIAGLAIALGIGIAVPGLGFVVGGTILAALSGGVAGVITGGLIGALGGIGVPEEKSLLYEKGVKEGAIVMAVHPHNADDANFIKNDWLMNNAKDMCC